MKRIISTQRYVSPLISKKLKTGRMHKLFSYVVPLTVLVVLSSCGTSPSNSPVASSPAASPNITSSPSLSLAPKKSPPASGTSQPLQTASVASTKTVPVTVYKLDNQCRDFVAEKTAVSANQSIAAAVGKVLENADSADFSLSGYRVNVASGVATVDLRVAPDSKRKLVSLSSCEQMAIFGSLRKTLTSNAQWKIKSVRFTDRGKEVVL